MSATEGKTEEKPMSFGCESPHCFYIEQHKSTESTSPTSVVEFDSLGAMSPAVVHMPEFVEPYRGMLVHLLLRQTRIERQSEWEIASWKIGDKECHPLLCRWTDVESAEIPKHSRLTLVAPTSTASALPVNVAPIVAVLPSPPLNQCDFTRLVNYIVFSQWSGRNMGVMRVDSQTRDRRIFQLPEIKVSPAHGILVPESINEPSTEEKKEAQREPPSPVYEHPVAVVSKKEDTVELSPDLCGVGQALEPWGEESKRSVSPCPDPKKKRLRVRDEVLFPSKTVKLRFSSSSGRACPRRSRTTVTDHRPTVGTEVEEISAFSSEEQLDSLSRPRSKSLSLIPIDK